MEEALKMRNLLQEFLKKHDGVRHPSILGLREHIFTGRYCPNTDTCYFLTITDVMVLYISDFTFIGAVFHLLHGLCRIKRPVL